jgi:broad specificity phosphatase PhoE
VIWYLSHPEVVIDPGVPVRDWGLSDKGRARVAALAARGWPQGTVRILTSPECKARETATILATALAATVEIIEGSGEVDRSATGYLPPDRHEALADALFAWPDQSAAGWETARAAQARIVAALMPYMTFGSSDLVIVGHGGVGTLLWCHIAGRPISRIEDQHGQGHFWTAQKRADDTLQPLSVWTPLEAL